MTSPIRARRGARGTSRVCLHVGEPEGAAESGGALPQFGVDPGPTTGGDPVSPRARQGGSGFKNVRVHDLRHTFGRRLRAAGVSFEDRQDLLGHRSTRVTTDYSAAELRNLLSAANRLKKPRKSPAMTVLRLTGRDSACVTY
jgi:Phage integrase family